MDVKFTSYMEDELDKIEEPHLDWVKVLHEFYDPFSEPRAGGRRDAGGPRRSQRASMPAVRQADGVSLEQDRAVPRVHGLSRVQGHLDVDCEGKPVVRQTTDHACERCGKPMILRPAGARFLGCSGYPECESTSSLR